MYSTTGLWNVCLLKLGLDELEYYCQLMMDGFSYSGYYTIYFNSNIGNLKYYSEDKNRRPF